MGSKTNKRKRPASPYRPSHCHWCGQKMSLDPGSIDWCAVYVAKKLQQFLEENNHTLPTQEQLEEVYHSTGGDPCDDCCCGACGRRKERPGQVCC